MAVKTIFELLVRSGIKPEDARDLIKRSGIEGEGILATNVGNLIFKAQQGELVLFTSKLQNPTKHAPYNAYAIGSDKRFVRLTSEYNLMDKALTQHLKVLNDDKKLISPEQMKTLKYNIVVRNQTKNEIDRLNKVLIDEGVDTTNLLTEAGITTSGRATGAFDTSVKEYVKQLDRSRETGVLPPESSVVLGKQTSKRQIKESEQELQTELDQIQKKLESDIKTEIDKLGKTTKDVKKDRLLTDDEYREFVEEIGDNIEAYDTPQTVGDRDKILKDIKDTEAEMFKQYQSGQLEKYVKPEVREASKLSYQKKIDKVLDKAYDEVFYQKAPSGDYKYDADVLADSIAEQLGKNYDDLPVMQQSQIYDTALKRISLDMKIKRDLKKSDELRKAQNEKYNINYQHQGAGKGFDKQFTPGGREGEFNAVTRQLLPMLHDRGIIKLDDEVLKSLKEAEHARGFKGSEFDPKKIFRYHFGDGGFNVLSEAIDKTPNAQSASDIVKYMSDNNLFGQFTVKKVNSPKNKFDHMTLTELQGVADEKRGIALLIKDGESPFYETADQIKKGSDENFGIMTEYLAKIRERTTRARRDQLAKIKKFPALDPNDPNFIISNLNDEGLVTAKSNRFQYSVEADPSGTTQFRTKYDTWNDATGTMREKPKLVEKQNIATGEIVVKDIDYNIPPTKDARMSLDIAIQMGDDVFDFSTEALGKKGYNLNEIDTIQKGRKVFKMLEEKKKVKYTQAEVDTPHPVFDINTGEVEYVSGGSKEGVDTYYTGRKIIEKLEELKDLGIDDIDKISVDEFDPTRYAFSKGGIANKDMVRFLFDDNVYN